MNQETLQELFVEQLRDVYDAEKQLVKALPKLAKEADSKELSEALSQHLNETQTHVSRLEEVFKSLGMTAKSKTCKGMKGLLEEGSEAIQEQDKGPLRDLALIAGCQKVEHYEISAYGTIRTFAENLGLDDAVELLQQTEDEEKEADEKLTEVAETLFDAQSSMDDDEEMEEEKTHAAGAGPSFGTEIKTPSRKGSSGKSR